VGTSSVGLSPSRIGELPFSTVSFSTVVLLTDSPLEFAYAGAV